MFRWLRSGPPPASPEKRRVVEALTDYPAYIPPRWEPNPNSLREAAAEYSTFFFENVDRRIQALGRFLEAFDVPLGLDDGGTMAVSAWFPLYADLLVDALGDDTIWRAYRGLETPWTGALLGLNPIFDLGIYCGKCLLVQN